MLHWNLQYVLIKTDIKFNHVNVDISGIQTTHNWFPATSTVQFKPQSTMFFCFLLFVPYAAQSSLNWVFECLQAVVKWKMN